MCGNLRDRTHIRVLGAKRCDAALDPSPTGSQERTGNHKVFFFCPPGQKRRVAGGGRRWWWWWWGGGGGGRGADLSSNFSFFCDRVCSDLTAQQRLRKPSWLCLKTSPARTGTVVVVVCRLLNVPATCQCISGTDLHRQFYVLPH